MIGGGGLGGLGGGLGNRGEFLLDLELHVEHPKASHEEVVGDPRILHKGLLGFSYHPFEALLADLLGEALLGDSLAVEPENGFHLCFSPLCFGSHMLPLPVAKVHGQERNISNISHHNLHKDEQRVLVHVLE